MQPVGVKRFSEKRWEEIKKLGKENEQSIWNKKDGIQ